MSVHQLRNMKILLGQVIGTKMRKTAKVRVERLVLDEYVMQYYPKRMTVFAHDAQQQAKEGDIVLVKKLPIPRSKNVKYDMEQIIYSLGNVTDPITGKKCDAFSYWEDSESMEDVINGGDAEGSVDRLSSDGQEKDLIDSKQRQMDGTPV
ncbi:28S ribosomal protein S17, mitochondrial-like [Asterias rubens]|uniref:28S ribosomal protein S17, mitochondrial-like n=1 Tax=Asterias rubens TaxID=7604 RepID=UPI001455CEF2|nr:28S ribosomal protein S17, mitochondrial-like [Asterias rubens]